MTYWDREFGDDLKRAGEQRKREDRPCDCASEKYRGVHIDTCTRTRYPATPPVKEGGPVGPGEAST